MTTTKKPVARTVTRGDEPARVPQRAMERDDLRADPNVIKTRSGRVIQGLAYTGNEDRYSFDRSIIPDGWDYQWKTKTIKNWEWVDHQVELAANGWEPVPAERHDGVFMPRGFKGNIERGGMILMERDMRLTMMARRNEKKSADEPVRNSREMSGMMARQVPGVSPDSMDFGSTKAREATGVRVERMPRLNDSKYTLEE